MAARTTELPAKDVKKYFELVAAVAAVAVKDEELELLRAQLERLEGCHHFLRRIDSNLQDG
jgi:hypothetical protein